MERTLTFDLNGHPVTVDGLSPNLTLLEFLRARGLTGAKEGCAEGDCGACSVAVLGRDAEGREAWRTVNSCLLPLPCLAGREVRTVEGIGKASQPHPVQRSLMEHHGSQCGYCTPGVAMSLYEACDRTDLRERHDLEEQLCGNLCRCTGYRPILDAARAALAATRAAAAQPRAAARPIPPLGYAAQGERFLRPASLEELRAQWRREPEARLLAGGTELGLAITKRFLKFPALIALDALPELQGIVAEPDGWSIGAAVPLSELEDHPALAAEFPEFREMLRWFGSRQIRNRATLGGNLATASPIGDSAPVLLALDARVRLAGRRERELDLTAFLKGYRKTALRPREILTRVLLPRPALSPGTTRRSSFYKVSRRREVDIATVSACFVVETDAHGRVTHARLAYGGVAATPVRARRTERALLGKPWNADTVRRVLRILANEFQPISDVRGSAAFRQGLIPSLLEKFFHEHAEETAAGLETGAAWSITASPQGTLPPPHESGLLHATGEAGYTDDHSAGMLEVWPVCAPHPHARILRREATAARALPGVRAILFAEDIPGVNDVGPVRADEPLLARDVVSFAGQIVALVVGESSEACRAAAARVECDYEPLPPILSIREAIEQNSFLTEPHVIRRGEVGPALAAAPHQLEGELAISGQDHFYLETHAAWARPGEGGTLRVMSSTQHPSEVQHAVARVLGVPDSQVTVEVPRVGGGFGGKETQAAGPAALAALAAWRTGQAVRVRYNRDQDMLLTGKRHPFLARFEAGCGTDGRLQALRVALFADGGWSLDLSQAICDRALLHVDNAYDIPQAELTGRVCRTHLPSNTAFRGFGGPQGMLVIEEILDRIARRLGLPPETVRERNLYHGPGPGLSQRTPYGMEVAAPGAARVWAEVRRESDFDARRQALQAWNQAHPHRKRGLAITPVKFGISFTVAHLNQGGALVLLYADGSAQVNHGGIEMGQGVHTNIRTIAARELGLSPARVRIMPTSTEKVPNTSPTAASTGTNINGAAVQEACRTLRERLAPVAARLLTARAEREVAPADVRFAADRVSSDGAPGVSLACAEVTRQAWLERVSLSATGYYRTPGIAFDWARGCGRPFHYFAVGAAVSEVEVDGFTGQMQVRRVDIVHDAGRSLNAGVNRGQVEGGFLQGLGWLTCEELKWDDQGRLLTHSPDTYKIPGPGDAPRDWRVRFLENQPDAGVVHGSKAVGEPPFMLALSVREAIREAVAAFGAPGSEVPLPIPATSEAIFLAVARERARAAATRPAQSSKRRVNPA